MAYIEGATVSLRPIEEADLAFVRDGVNHPAVRTLLGQHHPTTLDDERAFARELAERDDAVALLVTAEDTPVGVVELDPIDWQAGVADLAVWIHPDHQGRGYAREAVELLCAHAFDELGLHKVTADAYAANEASRALFESIGFTLEGVGREDAFFDGRRQDSYYFGLLADEWRTAADEGRDGPRTDP